MIEIRELQERDISIIVQAFESAGWNKPLSQYEQYFIEQSSGYIPDGKGIVWKNQFPKYGEQVTIDDNLNLYFTKKLK